jgi:UDP-glucose 4-epimerase
METIVTGAAGYVGSHVCNELLNQGFDVVAIDDLSTGKKEFLDARASFFQGKVQDAEFLNNVFSQLKVPERSGVIHCAGLKFAGESVKYPLSYYENNSVAVQVLLKAMSNFSLNALVFSSSCSVYGSLKDLKPVMETAELNPVSPYGRSKLFAEKMISDAMSSSELKAVALRYFNVAGNAAGVGFDVSPFNLLPNLYRAISSNSTFSVFGGDYKTPDGSCVRDYVDVSLLAKAHVVALQKLLSEAPLEFAYNLGSGVGASVFEIVNAAKSGINSNLKSESTSARAGDPAQILADVSLAKRDLGWDHRISIEEMVISGWDAWNPDLISSISI